MSEQNAERIPAAERREQIVTAASQVFGDHGFAGATTDQIARAAGISQPYVVRLFGSKERLFVEVLDRSLATILSAFRKVIGSVRNPNGELSSEADAVEELHALLGAAYADLITDRGLLLSLMHGFVLGKDPVIGTRAREGFLDVYRLLRDEAEFSPDDAQRFLAGGMLFNTVIALGMPELYESNDDAREFMECTFRSKLETVLHAASGLRE